jgi:DNA-directed RNA polymerase specialized sigma24 family protein
VNAHIFPPKKRKHPLAGVDMVRAAEPWACRYKGTKIWQTIPLLQLSKTSYLCPDMVTRAHLDNGVAILATIWGVQPNDMAARLAINLDFSHLDPKPLGERARRAQRHENTKYASKRQPNARRAFAPTVEATVKMIDNPKNFQKLRSMLMKTARSQTKDPMLAEDLVQETILSLCIYEVNDEEHLFRLARQILRRVITAYWRKEYNSPTTVTPHEDFYIMEDVYGISEEENEEEEPDTASESLTSDIAEAFVRVAAELSKQLGKKHAAVACGMREKTLSRILSPWE